MKDDNIELRDYFAAHAVIGILHEWTGLTNDRNWDLLDEEIAAMKAYQLADAMLVARKEKK